MVRLFRSGRKKPENKVTFKENGVDVSLTPKETDSAGASRTKPMLRVLCCALARLCGKDEVIESRSLLTSLPGMTTYRLDLTYAADRKGVAYNILRQHVSDAILEQLKNLSFVKGREVLVGNWLLHQSQYCISSVCV
ncbi:hypothetical protein FBUS_11028 [Fasciolopsis buskii]|uniref:GUCT domain-containing protein n=1 Tax=Fasciolopsis buskii TaxID=27845 RepID=A0A8E0RVT7_9TREM|nr:hypothetical protein FBUS_11028 [Fasciolopsis buski]